MCNNTWGNNGCCWIIILLLLFSCCGNGMGLTGGCGCGCDRHDCC